MCRAQEIVLDKIMMPGAGDLVFPQHCLAEQEQKPGRERQTESWQDQAAAGQRKEGWACWHNASHWNPQSTKWQSTTQVQWLALSHCSVKQGTTLHVTPIRLYTKNETYPLLYKSAETDA